MPRAPKLCNGDGGRCSNVQPCAVHAPKPWATSKRRMPPGWAAIRRRILKRDTICRACHSKPSAEVDHIDDREDHRDLNLQGLCSPCHRAKTQREAAAARRA